MNDRVSKQIINAGCACATDEGIWFVHYVIPLLMFYDFALRKITFARIIPCGESVYPCGLFGGIEYANEKIFLFPYNVKEMFIYDVKNDEFRECLTEDHQNAPRYIGVYKKNEYIYAIPDDNHRSIIKINTYNETIEYIPPHNGIPKINACSCIKNKGLLCATPFSSGAVIFDADMELFNELCISKRNCSIGHMDYFDDTYYGYDILEKKVLKINKYGEVMKESTAFDMSGALITHTCNGELILDSNYSSDIFILNRELHVIGKIDNKILNSKYVSPYLKGCWLEYNGMTFGILKSGELIIIDNESIEKIELQMDDTLWDSMVKRYVEKELTSKDSTLAEDELCTLQNFLEKI